jgi:asparagine synthase (glutamine-hydrolysing)
MAHSIEARVPFLDYRLVEFLFKLPEEWKIRGVTTKYILREAMQGILPEAIRTRKDKIGFKASSDFTFSYVQRNEEKLVRNENEFEYRWFKPEGVEQLFRQSDHSVNAEFEVWRIVNTKLWTRQFWGKTALKDLESHRN